MSVLSDNLKSPESDEAPEIFFDEAKTLIIACGALAKEILTIIQLNDLTHISLTCLPAKLHNQPDVIPARLEEKIKQYQQEYDRILVGFADWRLDAICRKYGVDRIQGAHCYAFFHGQKDFEALAEEELGTFYLTDYLVRQFDALIMEGMGINKYPQMLELMFGNYKRAVYLAQTDDLKLLEMAKDAADKLKLDLKVVKTGYGELADFIVRGDHIHKQ